jgi:hypothetical protein
MQECLWDGYHPEPLKIDGKYYCSVCLESIQDIWKRRQEHE